MPNPPKLTVLSLDGVPHGLAVELMDRGDMPNFARLCEQHGRPVLMRSVFPTVSCVAWACYATGRNPGKHGIYGFIDRRAGTYDLAFPNAATMRGPNLWEILSGRGKKVFGMNVPSTYPPRAVNGVLIGGFLAPSIEKVAYPPETAGYLRGIDYRIDSDAALARESKRAMLGDLATTLARRTEAMLHFLGDHEWDFFHTHVMGTDRINHFLLAQGRDGAGAMGEGFRAYYRKVDETIGRLLEAINDAPLMILSDHGFCPIRYEVQLSRYLVERGWTCPAEPVQHPLSIDPDRSRAFCMIPGRIYVNVRGREGAGSVDPGEYETVRERLTADLLALQSPEGEPVIRRVVRREELYWPGGADRPDPSRSAPVDVPPYGQAADLIAIPYDGFDLKMGMIAPKTFIRTELEGMHTAHDAMLFTRGVEPPSGDADIRRLAGPILDALDVDRPHELDAEDVPLPEGIL